MKEKIKLTNIYKSFTKNNGKTLKVLEDINFTIKEGELLALLGPSGSGKTTLLRIIAGLEEEASGSVDILKDKKNQQPFGMVFQEYSLLPWRTILENISFSLEIKGIDKEERKRKSLYLLKKFHLEEFKDFYPHELSGGMRQRVALCKAMVHSPEIILLDEPFGALDSQTRNKIQKEFIDFWKENQRTALLITHSIEEALFMAHRILILSPRPGKIIHEEKIELDYPREKHSKEFDEYYQRLSKIIEKNS